MEISTNEIKYYVQRIANSEISSYTALVWLKQHYQELCLHDLSLITALIDQPQVFYLLELDKYQTFLESLEEEEK